MKHKILYLTFAVIAMFMVSCQSKNYRVQVCSSSSDGQVWVHMRCPTIGFAGINKIAFDGFSYEDVEEEIFDGIRSNSYNGNYEVYVTLEYRDDHGNYHDGDMKLVSVLNGADVKEYASYTYFHGKSQIQKAYLPKY